MVPSATNLVVAAETTRLLLFDVPLAAHPAGKQVVSALMDVRLRRAMGFDDPPPWLCKMVDGVFWVRKMLLRYAILPRPWFLRKQKVSDEPDANGMLYQIYSPAEPWYVGPEDCNSRLTSFTGTSRTRYGTAGDRKAGSSGCWGIRFLQHHFSQEDMSSQRSVQKLPKAKEKRSKTNLSNGYRLSTGEAARLVDLCSSRSMQ